MKPVGAPPNRLRGEISGRFDGEPRILCLTLGALAELEGAYGSGSLSELCGRLAGGRFSALDLIRIIGAGLRGAGNRVSDEDVAAMSTEGGVEGMARMAAELLVAAFGPAGDPGGGQVPANPLHPQAG